MPRFVIRRPGQAARVFELFGDRPVSIGRAKSSTLVLDHDSVARQHALVRATPDGQWQIIERDTSNGVRVNGAVIKREMILRPNDEIALGDYRIRFEDPDVRGVITHHTSQLPARIAQELNESPYSGSAVGIISFDNAPPPNLKRDGQIAERLGALERENRLLTILYRVNRVLSELATVSEMAFRVLDLVLEIEGVERGYAMLLSETLMGQSDFGGGYEFQPALIRYRHERGGRDIEGSQNLIMSQSIVREAMRGGLPLLIADAKSDRRLAQSQSVALAGIQSAMCAPLGTRDRRYGLLYVDNLSQRGTFTVDQLNVFAVIAAQAGLAMDRLRARTLVTAGTVEQ